MATLEKIRSGRPFDAAFETAVAELSDEDRRLTHEIVAGVLRAQTELDDWIRPELSRGWTKTPQSFRDLLRIGAYQLGHLDRIPTYAAIQATVEIAKRRQGTRGAGLVNAVLRRLAAGKQRAESAARTPIEHLAHAESHPLWLVQRWVRRFGIERTGDLLRHNNRKPPLVIQPVRWSIERLRNALHACNIPVADAPGGAGLVVSSGRVADLPGFQAGAFVVQDPAQAHLLEYAAIPHGARVWDSCAAPGGKAAILSLRGPVVASDVHHGRLPRLKETLTRTAPAVPIFLADARHPPVRSDAVDVVLVDAPCTATGTLARHPDGRWRLSERSIGLMAARQARLLHGAATAVPKGGIMVYLTCSLETEENGDQVDHFLDRHPEFERDREDIFLFPPDTGTDGGFGARLRRSG